MPDPNPTAGGPAWFGLYDDVIARRPPFDPLDAVIIQRRYQVRAHKQHQCDGSRSLRLGHHQIQAGEHYELTRLVDRHHGSFRTYRVCEWCLHEAARIEDWVSR